MFAAGFKKTAGRLGERFKAIGQTLGMDTKRLRTNAAKELSRIRKEQGPQAASASRRLLLHDVRRLHEGVMGGQKAKGVLQ